MHHRTAKLDRIAVQLSGLCLLHCLALPLLIAVVPVLGPSIAMLKHAQAMLGLIKSPYCRMAIDAPTREQLAHLEHVMQRRRTGVSTVA